MSKFSPPPTKFGPQKAAQPKPAAAGHPKPAAAGAVLHHAPATRFAPASPAQPLKTQPPASQPSAGTRAAVAPPATRFAPSGTAQPKSVRSAAGQSAAAPPPPTRFGAVKIQPKSDTAATGRHAPPQTRFQGGNAVQPMRHPGAKGVIQAMVDEGGGGGIIEEGGGGGDPEPVVLTPEQQAAIHDLQQMSARLDQIRDLGAQVRTETRAALETWLHTDDVLNQEKRRGMIKQIDETYFAQRRIASELQKVLKVYNRSNVMPYLSTNNTLHSDLTYLSKGGARAVVMEVKTVSSEDNAAVWSNFVNARNQLQTRCVPGTYGKVRIQIANANNQFLNQTDAQIVDGLNIRINTWSDNVPVTEVTFLAPDGGVRRFRVNKQATDGGDRIRFVADGGGGGDRVTTVRPMGTHDAMNARVTSVLG